MIHYTRARSVSDGVTRAGRTRVQTGTDTYVQVAAQFSIGLATVVRWVQRARETGTVAPFDKAGGWRAPIDVTLLHALVQERPDRTTDKLTRAYNRRAATTARVHRSSTCGLSNGLATSSKEARLREV